MPHKTPAKTQKGSAAAPQGRVSKPIRKAIELIVKSGFTQRDAAKQAGIHEVSLSRALRKPHVQAVVEQEKTSLALEADTLKASAKSLAIITGIELMERSKSEQIRARMVEFFAREATPNGSPASVNINVNSGGYGYAKPGQQVVDITPSDDESEAKQGRLDS
jgi:hypothetical protein